MVEFRQYALDHVLHLFITPLLFRFIVFMPTNAGVAQGIQQAPRRMNLFAEKVLVQQCHLEDGYLQLAEQSLEFIRDAGLIEYELEDHADDIDSVVVRRMYDLALAVSAQTREFLHQIR